MVCPGCHGETNNPSYVIGML